MKATNQYNVVVKLITNKKGVDMTDKNLKIGKFYASAGGDDYETINDAKLFLPEMDKGRGGIEIWYKKREHRQRNNYSFVDNILMDVVWDGNDFFRTHAIIGELNEELFELTDKESSLYRIYTLMNKWSAEHLYDQGTDEKIGDRFVRRLLDKHGVEHINLELGDIVSFLGQDFIYLQDYDATEKPIMEIMWCQILKRTNKHGRVTDVDLIKLT